MAIWTKPLVQRTHPLHSAADASAGDGAVVHGLRGKRSNHRLPEAHAGGSPIKVLSFPVEITLKIERAERLWTIGDVAVFILKSLDDGEAQLITRMPA